MTLDTLKLPLFDWKLEEEEEGGRRGGGDEEEEESLGVWSGKEAE